jgi:hypothetical protein
MTDISRPCNCTAHIHCPRCKGADGVTECPSGLWCIDCGHKWAVGATQNAGATPTDKPVEVGAHSSSSLLSPVEGRHDKPEHVCGLSGFCPAPPHWDECPACDSKETK